MQMVTKQDKDKLEARLRDLIAQRPLITKRIEEARAHGDLRENGDYHAARDDQGRNEMAIRELEEKLKSVMVIDDRMKAAMADTVVVGSTIKLRDEGNGDIDVYKLVGEASGQDTGDIIEVTDRSPMGEALFKRKVGEEIRVNAPRGVKRFTIVSIE
ncbi:MAG: transcription elongation factor GreA [Phycisphaerales bacterium]